MMGVNAGMWLLRGTSSRAGVDERRPATGDSGICGRQDASLNVSLGTREVLPEARLLGGLSRERGNCDGCPVCPVVAFCGSSEGTVWFGAVVDFCGSWEGTGWFGAVVALEIAATDRLAPGRSCRCARFSGTVDSLAAEAWADAPIALLTGWMLLRGAALAREGGMNDRRGSGALGTA